MGDYPKGRVLQTEYKKITGSRKQVKLNRAAEWLQQLKDSGIPLVVAKNGREVSIPDPKKYYKYRTRFLLRSGRWVRGLNVLGDPMNKTFTGGAEKFIQWYNLNEEF